MTHRRIAHPVPLLLSYVSPNVLSQTIKPIKMEVNWIKGSDVSFAAKSLPSRCPKSYWWLSYFFFFSLGESTHIKGRTSSQGDRLDLALRRWGRAADFYTAARSSSHWEPSGGADPTPLCLIQPLRTFLYRFYHQLLGNITKPSFWLEGWF